MTAIIHGDNRCQSSGPSTANGSGRVIGESLCANGQTGGGYDRPGKPRIAWDDECAQQDLISALVEDGLAVLDGLDLEAIDKEPSNQAQAQAVALLALVTGQDVEPAPGSDGTDGRWRIAPRTAPDRVISTVDTDTRHAHKTRARQQDGFKGHIVNEPETGLVTAIEMTKAAGPDTSDGAVGARLLLSDPTVADDADDREVLGDSAYASGDMLATLARTRWNAVIKPKPHMPAVAGGFVVDDFTFDADANTLTCPNNLTRPVSAKGHVTYGAACHDCPLRARCTTAVRGRKISFGEHHQLQREHRQHFSDNTIADTYRQHRPMVERTIAWLTRGNRRVPYRGIERNNNWLHHRAAAINLRRLITLGLTITNGTWTLATA